MTSFPRPDVSLRRGADRHQTRIGWLHGRHSFDTGIDPLGSDTHHGVLVVSNHDTIAPGSGFETHPHRNMEIVTWVLNGSLVHQDSEGHAGIIYPNLTQRDRGSAPVLDECLRRGIAFVPFCPLGLPRGPANPVLTSPVVIGTAARLGVTPPQVALQWLLRLAPDVLLIPGTASVAHLLDNLAAEHVALDDQALRELAGVGA